VGRDGALVVSTPFVRRVMGSMQNLEPFRMSIGRLRGVSQELGKMDETLSETFALWPCNAEKLIKNTEDWFSCNMMFDSTASNKEHVTAACVTIHHQLGRALLRSACHHHIGEVISSHVFDDMKIIETSKSLEATAFARFRKHFQLLGSHRSASLR